MKTNSLTLTETFIEIGDAAYWWEDKAKMAGRRPVMSILQNTMSGRCFDPLMTDILYKAFTVICSGWVRDPQKDAELSVVLFRPVLSVLLNKVGQTDKWSTTVCSLYDYRHATYLLFKDHRFSKNFPTFWKKKLSDVKDHDLYIKTVFELCRVPHNGWQDQAVYGMLATIQKLFKNSVLGISTAMYEAAIPDFAKVVVEWLDQVLVSAPKQKYDAVVYGGSFDPPHIGHLSALKEASAAVAHTRMLVVPCSDNPLKDRKLSPYQTRMAMCHALFGNQATVVNGQKWSPYTVSALSDLMKEHPDTKNIAMVVGSDCDMSQWKGLGGVGQYPSSIMVGEHTVDIIWVNRVTDQNIQNIRSISSTGIRNSVKKYGWDSVAGLVPDTAHEWEWAW